MKRAAASFLAVLLVSISLPVSAHAALTDGLVSYYHMNGDSTDGYGTNDGTDTSMSYSSGFFDQAASFSGTSGHYISLPSGIYSLVSGTSKFSINMWIYVQSYGASGRVPFFISTGSGTSWNAVNSVDYRLNSAGSLQGNRNGDNAFGTAVSTATWTMVTMVYDGTNFIMYKNGSNNSSVASSGSISGTTVAYVSNHSAASEYMDGLVDEVAVYNRDLSSTEVSSLYNSGAGLDPTATGGSYQTWALSAF